METDVPATSAACLQHWVHHLPEQFGRLGLPATISLNSLGVSDCLLKGSQSSPKLLCLGIDRSNSLSSQARQHESSFGCKPADRRPLSQDNRGHVSGETLSKKDGTPLRHSPDTPKKGDEGKERCETPFPSMHAQPACTLSSSCQKQ